MATAKGVIHGKGADRFFVLHIHELITANSPVHPAGRAPIEVSDPFKTKESVGPENGRSLHRVDLNRSQLF